MKSSHRRNLDELTYFEIGKRKFSIVFDADFVLFSVCEYRRDLGVYIFYTGIKADSLEDAITIFKKRELERG